MATASRLIASYKIVEVILLFRNTFGKIGGGVRDESLANGSSARTDLQICQKVSCKAMNYCLFLEQHIRWKLLAIRLKVLLWRVTCNGTDEDTSKTEPVQCDPKVKFLYFCERKYFTKYFTLVFNFLPHKSNRIYSVLCTHQYHGYFNK